MYLCLNYEAEILNCQLDFSAQSFKNVKLNPKRTEVSILCDINIEILLIVIVIVIMIEYL